MHPTNHHTARGTGRSRRQHAARPCGAALFLLAALFTAACDNGTVAGPAANLAVSPAAAQPGAMVRINGLPATVQPGTHWVEVGGQRAPLIRDDEGAAFMVPAFLDEAQMWPAPPAGAQDVEIRSASGVAGRVPEGLTVHPLQPADGTTAQTGLALLSIPRALAQVAARMPAGSGESRRFMLAIGGALDSLYTNAEFGVATAVADLHAEPQQLRLLDALLASSGQSARILRVATTLSEVAWGLPVPSAIASSSALQGAAALNTPSTLQSPSALQTTWPYDAHIAAGASIDVLSDDMLSQLMQLAVYLKQNTDFQSELGSDLSAVLSLAGVLGIDADKVAPIGKALDAIAAVSSLQALVVNTYVVSALPSRLDSITVELASDTIPTDAATSATIEVFASNEPDPVSLGDLLSTFQNIAGLFAKGDWFEKTANFLIGKSSDLLAWIAASDTSFEYDKNIVDLWSMPDVSFRATIENADLVVLKTADASVVAPLEGEANWKAVTPDSGTTTVTVEPSIGEANIPILMEWFADFISENSGAASDMVLGSFGEDIVASAPVQVWVQEPKEEILFTFAEGKEGWSSGTTSSGGWGTAYWQEWCGSGREEGCIKTDGVGGGSGPNAWFYNTIDIPQSATTLSFLTSAHNRVGSDSEYRIRIQVDGAFTTLIDWTATSGNAPDLTWGSVSVPIGEWAGRRVTFFFEGRDNGPGTHEQRYFDDIRIY